MIVLKFGGTSVGTEQSIRSVRDIIIQKIESGNKLMVVVSAVGGITNRLEKAALFAERGDTKYERIVSDIQQLHFDIIRELIPIKKQSAILGEVKLLLNDLEDILKGIYLLKEITPKSHDFVLSFGERLSSIIIFNFLKESYSDTNLINPQQLIICDNHFGNGRVDMELSIKNTLAFKETFSQLNICPGFIAATKKGQIITLGRGGSDYSAALLANFLNAEKLEIWTDVGGLMTADPGLVPNARVIPHLSYEEALELSHFGAKVIYPPTIQPALEKNIPIEIKNTFKPADQGTMITRSWEDADDIRGISSINNISLLNLSGSGMVGIPNFSYRLFQALSEKSINVIMITQASSEHTICIGIESKSTMDAVDAINHSFQNEIKLHKVNPVDVEDEMAIIALVGSNMKNQVGVSGKLFSALGNNGVNVKAIAQGSSERNISIVISRDDLKKAVNTLHESFFVGEMKRLNIFMIGVGNVGTALLDQFIKQTGFLKKHHNIDLSVAGIANSKQMYFNQEGISLNEWRKELVKGEEYSSDRFLESMISMNMRNCIFLDITGSADIPELYPEILKKSIAVVTPNKIAATSPYQHYTTLKHLSRKFKTQFLFETNVCAGLPVISTVNDLVKSGDTIHKIEAVLSGTLNFIFNQYNGVDSFAKIVVKAKKEGYSEPDPRLDLSGEDVKRKILILARESGYRMEIEDVSARSFIPKHCLSNILFDDFIDSLEKEEEYFRKMYKKALVNDQKLRFVATYENGKAEVGLSHIGKDHPFYQLEGKDNIVLFYTERYKEQPLTIKGAGAGSHVTASGIFADIMKVANSHQ